MTISPRLFVLPMQSRLKNKGLHFDCMMLVVILSCALALRLYFYVGMGPRDDIAYIGLAHALQTNNFHLPAPSSEDVFAVRMMTYLPIFISWKLFGISEPATCAYFILCSLCLIVTGYCLGRVLYGRSEAFIAACLLSLIPMDIVFSSQ
ncbi:MAG: hypothetical protein WCQ99_11750, partial [Pseudomonadota bacterium]